MPSKQSKDLLAVEDLVLEIKENLRLKSRPASSHSRAAGRPAMYHPYFVPCRSWSETAMMPPVDGIAGTATTTTTTAATTVNTIMAAQTTTAAVAVPAPFLGATAAVAAVPVPVPIIKLDHQLDTGGGGGGGGGVVNFVANIEMENNSSSSLLNASVGSFNHIYCTTTTPINGPTALGVVAGDYPQRHSGCYRHHFLLHRRRPHYHQHHHHHHHQHNSKDDDDLDDPFELLQALIKNNSLVKEAVRRLQLNLSPKQRYFYESDDDSRSPIIRMCQLEL